MRGRKDPAPFQKYLHTAIIRGYGSFPIDMLRYDSAWPASEQEAGKIVQTFEDHGARWEIKVQRRSWKEFSHDTWEFGRWESFQCKVEPVPS